MLTVAQLIVVALVTGFANVIFDVANATFLPEIVDRDQLQARNGLMSGTFATTQLGGPSLGGVAVQLLGAVPTLLVDAVSYLVSAAFMRTCTPPDRDAGPPVADVADDPRGLRVCRPAPDHGTGHVDRHRGELRLPRPARPVPALPGQGPARRPAWSACCSPRRLGTLIGASLTTRFTNAVGTARGILIAGYLVAAGAFLIPVGSGWRAYATSCWAPRCSPAAW